MAKNGRVQSKVLPIEENISVKEQFGFLPLSVIKPTNESKNKWKGIAYLNDGDIEIRKVSGGAIKELKMSEFHAGIAENIVRFWSMPGAKIVDPFAGRATRAVVSTYLGREYYGYEITPNTFKRNNEHFDKLKINPTLYMSDGTLLKETPNDFADLIYTCPPYYNIEEYESVEGQLSDCDTYDSFMRFIDRCAENCFRVLKYGAFCVWVVADFRQGGKLIDFHGDTIQSFKKAGFNYHDIIIMENISPFATLTTFQAACKRYAPKVHEYILVFRKPGEYIVPEYCTENIVESVNKLNQFFG
jgi:DNA modification methylase